MKEREGDIRGRSPEREEVTCLDLEGRSVLRGLELNKSQFALSYVSSHFSTDQDACFGTLSTCEHAQRY